MTERIGTVYYKCRFCGASFANGKVSQISGLRETAIHKCEPNKEGAADLVGVIYHDAQETDN